MTGTGVCDTNVDYSRENVVLASGGTSGGGNTGAPTTLSTVVSSPAPTPPTQNSGKTSSSEIVSEHCSANGVKVLGRDLAAGEDIVKELSATMIDNVPTHTRVSTMCVHKACNKAPVMALEVTMKSII